MVTAPSPPKTKAKRRFAGAFAQTFGQRLLTLLVGVATAVLLARVLGPDGRGQLALAVLLLTFLHAFCTLGMPGANVYFVGRGDVRLRSAFRGSLLLWLPCSLAALLVGFAVASLGDAILFPGVEPLLLVLAVLCFPLGLMHSLVMSLLQGQERWGPYNAILIVESVLRLGATAAALLVFEAGAVGAMYAHIASTLLLLLLDFALLDIAGNDTGSPSLGAREYASRCWRFGWKLQLNDALNTLNYRVDQYIVNLLASPAATGIYAVAVTIIEKVWLVSSAAATVLYPRLASLHDDEEARRRLTPEVTRLVLLVTLPTCVGLGFLAEWVVVLLFGAPYAEAAVALRWLIPGVLVMVVAHSTSVDLNARGRPEHNLVTGAVVLVLNVGGNLLLIPRYGIAGAAIATSFAYLINMSLKLTIYRRLSGNTWGSMLIVRGEDVRRAASMLRGGLRR